MGQYHMIANVDKKQFLNPHRFGSGIKLLEFGSDGRSAMTGLAILLTTSNNRGGGDLRSDHPIIGTWAGDRVIIAGDYADPGLFMDDAERAKYPEQNVYALTTEDDWTDVSYPVIEAMMDDPYLAEDLARAIGPSHWSWDREGGTMPASLRRKLVKADKERIAAEKARAAYEAKHGSRPAGTL